MKNAVFYLLCILLPAGLACAVCSVVVGGPEIVIEGTYAELAEFEEVEYWTGTPEDLGPYEAWSRSSYELNAYANQIFYVTIGEEYELQAFLENAPPGMGAVFEFGKLKITWETPLVEEPTAFGFSCGVEVRQGAQVLETLSRSISVTVRPALPALEGNLLTSGFRIYDAWSANLNLTIFDPDEPIDGDELRIETRDPRLIFSNHETDPKYWTLKWNDAWPAPARSELVPLRFAMRDFDGTGSRWTTTELPLMIFGYDYEDARLLSPFPADGRRFGSAVELLDLGPEGPLFGFIVEPGVAVHVFEFYGYDGEWYYQTSLPNPDLQLDFGSSLSAAGGVLAVGAPNLYATGPGSVFIYEWSPYFETWYFTQVIRPDEPDQAFFGADVALTETFGPSGGHFTLMASADDAASQGAHTGAAWVYQRSGLSSSPFVKHQVLVPSDAEAYDYFSWPLALRGDTAVLPANEDDDVQEDSGAVYVYRRNTETGLWTQQQKLKADDASYGDLFGERVAISEQGIFVAAFRKRTDSTRVGAVYHFQEIDGIWQERGRIRSIEEASIEEYYEYDCFGSASLRREHSLQRFGSSIAAEGNSLFVAGRRKGRGWPAFDRSVVYHFEWNEGSETWEEIRVLCGSDTDDPDIGNFGKVFGEAQALVVAGNQVMVGDFGSEFDNYEDSGIAYTFFRDFLPAPPSGEIDRFYEDLAIHAPGLADPGQDADGDGTANLTEFFAGTPARQSGLSPAWPVAKIGADGNGILCYYFREGKNQSGLQPEFLISRTLEPGSWLLLERPRFLPDEDQGDHLLRGIDLSAEHLPGSPLFVRMRLSTE